jgi:DNA-binding NtrC family response regulator
MFFTIVACNLLTVCPLDAIVRACYRIQEIHNLRILLAGPSKTADEHRSWIVDELSAEVQLIDDLGDLMSILASSAWDLLLIDNAHDGIIMDEFVRSVKIVQPTIPIIALCGDTPQEAIEVMRLGISDYLVRPVEKTRLLASIKENMTGDGRDWPATIAPVIDEGAEPLTEKEPVPEDIIFEGSSKMAAVRQVVEKILDVDLPVLLTGESGTGKDVIAQYIYSKSKRNGHFVKVNCAAIPSELLESELFGYERGAFTGAYRRKPGKFEAASGGFLFLDEISELSYPLQSKLLHVLQDGTVSTLGSTKEVQVDVRIIVATNQDLELCVQKGTFRDDLFFRLNVVHINVPPLRERLKQLEVLIDYFRQKFARQYNTNPVHLDDDAKSFLYNYRWPGNIRELENTIRRATVLGAGNLLGNINGLGQLTSELPPDRVFTPDKKGHLEHIGAEDAAFEKGSPGDSGGDEIQVFPDGLNLKEIGKEAAIAAEREAIARVLQQTRWNRKKTAQILRVSYKTLLTKIKETGLDEN